MRTTAFVVVTLIGGALAVSAQAKLVACVGDSITYGSGLANRAVDSYPAQLQRILRQCDLSWEVRNFGVSGTTLLTKGDLPYVRQSAFGDAQACRPDVVIIKLGRQNDALLDVDPVLHGVDQRPLGGLRPSTADVYFGVGQGLEPGSFWSGLLDDIRVYGRAITP